MVSLIFLVALASSASVPSSYAVRGSVSIEGFGKGESSWKGHRGSSGGGVEVERGSDCVHSK